MFVTSLYFFKKVTYKFSIKIYEILPSKFMNICLFHSRPPPASSRVVIVDAHAAKTNVTHLHVQGKSPTVYQFNLTVTDEQNLTSSDVVLVTVTKGVCVCVCVSVSCVFVSVFVCVYVCVGVCVCVCICVCLCE